MNSDTKQEPINAFMKKFRSKAHVNFTQGREVVAYGWKSTDMKREVQALIEAEVTSVLEELENENVSIYPNKDKAYVPLELIQQLKQRYGGK